MTILETLREFRIGDYAIFDFAISYLAVYVMAPWLTKIFRKLGLEISRKNWLFLTLPFAVLAHMIVGEMTPLTKAIMDPTGHWITKLVMLGFLILGIKGIKRL